MRCVAFKSIVPQLTRRNRPFRRVLAVCAMSLAMSGCILHSEHPEAALEIPSAYRGGKNKPEAAVPSLDWWRGFRSEELTQLIQEAQKSNLDIAVATAQIVQADAQIGITGAALFPSLTGSGFAEKERVSATRTTPATTFSLYNVGLSASYIVDFWGKNHATLFAAEKSAIASRYNREVVTVSSIVAVANTYFQILAAQDQLAVARKNLAAANHILDLVNKQFAAGTASQLDVSQQAAVVATVRASIPPLEVTLKQNISALAVLVARAPADFNVKGRSLSQVTVPRVTPGLPSELLLQRPDIRQAEATLESSNFSVESARAAFLPQIQLTGTTGFQSQQLSRLFTPGAWYYTMVASLTQPIFDGGLLKNQLLQARGVQLQNLQAYRKAVLSGFSDVEQALIALEQTTIQLKLQNDVVTNSRKAFEIAELQLAGGTVNLITVLQTEQTLFTAETNLVQVRLSRMLAATSLFQALGGGWLWPLHETPAPTP
jgi:outer membrane protein, multidrug efflux system